MALLFSKKPAPELRLPNIGERFREEHLPPVAKAHYKALSRIYGIPLHEMTPYLERVMTGLPWHAALIGERPHLSIDSHSVVTSAQRFDIYTPNQLLTHELLHTVKNLLKPYRSIPEPSKLSELSSAFAIGSHGSYAERVDERITGVPIPVYAHAIPQLDDLIHAVAWGILISPKVTLLLLPFHAALRAGRALSFKRFYKKHGAGGNILLIAKEPKRFEPLLLHKYERQFIKQGLLREEGGLTHLGAEAIRHAVPKKVLLERLAKAQQEFEKEH
jgi:hypothetical protein